MNRNYLPRIVRGACRAILWLLLAVAGLIGAYAAAALAGTLVPVNGAWQPPERGVRIFVEDNGVHTGIVVPAVAAGFDWRGVVRPQDIADPRHTAHGWIAFGWGDAGFYRNTPRWADLRPATALGAIFGGGPTVLHVEHIGRPTRSARVRSLLLRPAEYRRLAGYIRASFAEGPPASVHGYGAHDAFYAARGRYGVFRTCNEWTGGALRHAGVRMGAWTPLPPSVLFWLS